MGLNFTNESGQTPLNPDECEGLLIHSISTQSELDEFEQNNIEQAMIWTSGKRFTQERLLSESFIKLLHQRMFGDIWNWAGKFRSTEKNIGIKSWQISTSVHTLLEDVQFWIENKTYSPDEIAIRFKHRLVSIHCFSNGNGRHSRLMADLIAENIFKLPPFSWGQAQLFSSKNPDIRREYLAALKKADSEDIRDLVAFARK